MKKIMRTESSDNGDFYHPPLNRMPDIPCANHYGAFGVKRKFDSHLGIDLYSPEGANVYAIEDGEVVAIRPFTGEVAGTPFWENTQCVDIEGFTGTFGYGEVTPRQGLKVGDLVKKGDFIAQVKRVLKEYKGKATSMLHLQLHRSGWKHLYKDQQDPEMESFYDHPLDITNLLIQLKNKADLENLRRLIHIHQ